MNINFGLIIGAGLISLGTAISHRYEVTAVPVNPTLLIRIDHWTGKMENCENSPLNPGAAFAAKYRFSCSDISN